MLRHIHYEAAFEDYLRSCGWPYIPVDEHRKAIFSGVRVKSFDFLVYRKDAPTWLVDIKGRRFPYDHDGRKRYWENWVTREDLEGLTRWQETFGAGFVGMLVFAYLLTESDDRQPSVHIHAYRGNHYAFMTVAIDEYRQACRQRSPKWDTLSLPTKTFRDLAKPLQLV